MTSALEAYERGKRDGALEMRERCAKVAMEMRDEVVAHLVAQAIAALPVPGQPEKDET